MWCINVYGWIGDCGWSNNKLIILFELKIEGDVLVQFLQATLRVWSIVKLGVVPCWFTEGFVFQHFVAQETSLEACKRTSCSHPVKTDGEKRRKRNLGKCCFYSWLNPGKTIWWKAKQIAINLIIELSSQGDRIRIWYHSSIRPSVHPSIRPHVRSIFTGTLNSTLLWYEKSDIPLTLHLCFNRGSLGKQYQPYRRTYGDHTTSWTPFRRDNKSNITMDMHILISTWEYTRTT